MNVIYTGHGTTATDPLKELTEKKLKKLTRHSNHISSIHITFEIQHHDQIAKALLTIDGHEINAKANSNNMYHTVDLLVDILDRQLIKHKEKLTNHRDQKPDSESIN